LTSLEKNRLIATLFADDTTVFLSKEDKFADLQSILNLWCNASSAKFNINKTSILPIGNGRYRELLLASCKMHPDQNPISPDIEIVPEMSVRILGAFVGNKIDQMSVWM